MNKPRQPAAPARDSQSTDAAAADRGQARDEGRPEDLQPPPTGGNQGSPAAPVMKQFQKTGKETSGRS